MEQIKYDFHLHSCLSPCGDDDMTPANVAGMAALAGFQAVALTDHNTTGNCRAFCRAASAMGLVGIPGMELTTAEDIHVVCLFDSLLGAEEFGSYVHTRLTPRKNQPEIYGHQLLLDDEDRILGEEDFFLAGSTDIGIYQTAQLVKDFHGLAYPAHIDRASFSLLSVLGLWDESMGFHMAELSRRADRAALEARADLTDVPFVTGCDAHYLYDIPDAKFQLAVEENTPASILQALRQLKK